MTKVKKRKLIKLGPYSTVMVVPSDLMKSHEKIKAQVEFDPKNKKAKIFY